MLQHHGDKSAADQANVIEQGRHLIREQERRRIEPRSVDLFHCNHSAGQAVDRRMVEQTHGQQAQTDRAQDVRRIVVALVNPCEIMPMMAAMSPPAFT